MLWTPRLFAALSLVVWIAPVGFADPPTPPAQPATGPGGAAYAHTQVVRSVHGKGGKQFHLFEPASPKPATAPLIVFNHGWAAMDPIIYGAWIEHIVRRGSIVVFPRYQADVRTPSIQFTPNAIASVKAAIKVLRSPGHVRPNIDRFAIVGHSAGGLISANMAAEAAGAGLPKPRALMAVQPGLTPLVPMADLAKVPADTLLITVAGDRDTVTKDKDAKLIIRRTTRVPNANKNFLVMPTDTRGVPQLISSHRAPVAVGAADTKSKRQLAARLRRAFPAADTRKAGGGLLVGSSVPAQGLMVDALDYYGFWKLFDALCDAAFHGKHRDYALGNTPKQRFMGKWSDGTPVAELQVRPVK